MTHEQYLTDVNSLSNDLRNENLIIVDCHWDSNAYLRAHIPDAIMRTGHPYIKSMDQNGNPSKYMPDSVQFVDLMKKMGISSDSKVVCYDEWQIILQQGCGG